MYTIILCYVSATPHSAHGSSSGEEDNVTFDPSALECQQLVLDVPEGTRVKLARKENGRRSQLWRMTSTGRLQHEGSSPPHDPSSRKAANNAATLVCCLPFYHSVSPYNGTLLCEFNLLHSFPAAKNAHTMHKFYLTVYL